MTRFCHFVKVAIFGLSLASIGPGTLATYAANPELVGIIAAALDPALSTGLELSEEQTTKLRALAEKQESAALNLASALRELPPSERDAKKRAFVRDFEQLAYKELTMQQRSRLERIRLSKLGLASLVEPEVSEMLGLSQGQIDQVNQILSSRLELVRTSGEEQAKRDLEKRLRDVVTAGQWATWQALAGQSARSNIPTATADNSNAVANSAPIEIPKAVPEKVVSIEPSQASKPALEANSKAAIPTSPSDQKADSSVSPLRISDEKPLVLNFDKMPWEQVLQWIAKEAELSLQVDTFPPGSFTYRDPYRKYSVGEAIDVMNGTLLKSAYRLIRRQRSLMLLELGDGERSEAVRGLLREFAELVPPEELDKRGEFELLKCLFVLTRVSPEDAQRQITLLLGPEGSTIPLGSAGQILVTDTAGKLKLIREMLRRVEDPESSLASKVLTLHLKHVAAEEVLSVARGLLGLNDGTNSSDEIRMTTDAFGNTIFATGAPEKLQLLKDTVTQVDIKPGEGESTAVSVEAPKLRVHPIQSSDPDTAFNVLQTLLEGSPNTRMTLEPKTNSIVASASEADHKLIDDTLKTLAGESSSFTVFPLVRLDTQTALTTLEKVFGKSSGSTGTGSASSASTSGPIFLGDSLARTIMVKGSPQELAQVREVLSKLEESGPDVDTFGSNMRVLPMTGKSADRVLDQIQFLWDAQKKKNRIKIRIPGEEKSDNSFGDKAPPADDEPPVNVNQPKSPTTTRAGYVPRGRLVGTSANASQESGTAAQDGSEPSDIVIYRGPTGLVITCDDPKVLAEFEQLVRMVTDQMMSGAAEPTVFYLKYVTAKSAEELLKSLLAGDSSGGTAASGGGGGLLGNVLGEMGGGLVGGLLGLGGGVGGGSATSVSGGMASGEVTIIADPRLNSLLVTANPIDLDLVDQLLKIIDKEDSPLRIETQGVPHIIPVIHSSAEEIADIVKQAFADKMGQSASGGGGGGGQQRQQPSPQEFIEALRGAGGGGGRGGSRGASELKPQTMTVSVDKKNNALIVTASNSLAEQVRAFVETIDQASETGGEKIEVVQLNGAKTELFQNALKSMFGEKAKTSSTSGSGSTTASSSSGSSNSDAESAERRAEFLRAIQSRFGTGGPGSGGGDRASRGTFPGGGIPGSGGGTRGGPPGSGGRQ